MRPRPEIRDGDGDGFGDYLVGVLKANRLTMEAMCAWIAEIDTQQAIKTKFGVKEQLRVLRLSNASAIHYPLYGSLVRFFEKHAPPKVSDRLRFIFATQARDEDLLPSELPISQRLQPNMDWMYVPCKSDKETARQYERWKFLCFNGDHDLYRESIHFYRSHHRSYVHAPVRKLIAIDLARICILNGDYLYGFLIARRYANAFREHTRSRHGNYFPQGYDISTVDIEDFLYSLQIIATSISHLSFNNPYYPAKRYFEEAQGVLDSMTARSQIGEDLAFRVRMNLKIRYLRTLSRCMLIFGSQTIGKHSEIHREVVRTLRDLELLSMENKPYQDTFTLYDTIARVYVLMERADVLSAGEHYFSRASAIRSSLDTKDRLAMGAPSKLRRMRSDTTQALLFAVKAALSSKSSTEADELLAGANRILDEMVRDLGSDNTWHARLLITEARRKIDSIIRHSKENLAEDMVTKMHENYEISLIERLEARANSYREVFFEVTDLDEHDASLRQATQFRESSIKKS